MKQVSGWEHLVDKKGPKSLFRGGALFSVENMIEISFPLLLIKYESSHSEGPPVD